MIRLLAVLLFSQPHLGGAGRDRNRLRRRAARGLRALDAEVVLLHGGRIAAQGAPEAARRMEDQQERSDP
jgi:hypothetical protein